MTDDEDGVPLVGWRAAAGGLMFVALVLAYLGAAAGLAYRLFRLCAGVP